MEVDFSMAHAAKGDEIFFHIPSEPRGSLQKRPMGDGSKPANGAARNLILLSLFLLLRQARFCAPASWAAFQDVSVVEQAVEHGGDGGAVAE
jgi:hypothetical protein